MYVEGRPGGGRIIAILFYSYHIWIVGNVGYWLGWLCRRQNRFREAVDKLGVRFGRYILLYCAVMGLLLAGIIYKTDLREITSYRAYRNWRQGWAKQYAEEWEERLEVLHDDSVGEASFAPLSVYPEMLLYTDLQDEDGYVWVNEACAEYYGKDAVRVIGEE